MRRVDPEVQEGVDGSEEAFGPPAVLLVGFDAAQHVEAFRGMMLDMEAHMFKVVPCQRSMLNLTLQEALEADSPTWEPPTPGLGRVVVLSGMYSAEVVEVVAAYKASGLPPTVFAAAVPNNMDRKLADLVNEVTAEDVAMRRMYLAESDTI